MVQRADCFTDGRREHLHVVGDPVQRHRGNDEASSSGTAAGDREGDGLAEASNAGEDNAGAGLARVGHSGQNRFCPRQLRLAADQDTDLAPKPGLVGTVHRAPAP